jgi:site-specific DNA recombinase
MKAVGYIRVSSQEQAQPGRFSLERQRTTIEQRAIRDGCEVVQWFQDVESGEHVNREGYQAMLVFLRRKEAERVYIWESSRLGRNDREFLRCCWELEDLGIGVVSCTQDLQNVLLRYVYAWKATEDNAELRKRISGGLKTSACKGHWIGMSPYGYKRDPTTKKLLINEETASVIREIFSEYLRGKGLRVIAKRLNSQGIRTATGRIYGVSSLRYILTNPVYVGQTKNRYVEKESHLAIVDRDQWEQAQKVLKTKYHAGKMPASEYLLSGTVYCQHCGAHMIGATTTGQGAVYTSATGIPEPVPVNVTP